METAKLRFTVEKETKGAVRYQEVDAVNKPVFAPKIGTLYVRKSAMNNGSIPQVLDVTVVAVAAQV